jgi:molecular chaperone GrpE
MGRQTRKGNDKDNAHDDVGAADGLRDEVEALQAELDALRAERDDLQERLQRAAADYQNLKRRGLAESEERLRRAMQPLLDKMLIVLDYLDMALASPTTHDESKNLAIGVRLTRDQFLQALEQEDVRIVPSSEMFDPTTQEAKAAVERDDVPPGTVLETVRSGYTWRGEILRYAQVIVAKEPEETKA